MKKRDYNGLFRCLCGFATIVPSLLFLLSMYACKKNDIVTEDPFLGITVTRKQEAFVAMTTATWCSSCGIWGIPTFDGAFEGENGIDSSRINGLALHYSPDDSLYCLMAEKIRDGFGILGTPNLWVEFNNTFNLQPSRWEDAIKQRCAETSPVCAIGMGAKYQDGICTLYVKTRFYTSIPGPINLAVYAVENGKKATQAGSSSGNSHQHNLVLRGEVSSGDEWGKLLVTEASNVDYKVVCIYRPDSGITLKNVRFVAVVYQMEQGLPVSALNSNTY